MSNAAKEARAIADEAVRQGWRLRGAAGTHYFLFAPDGEGKVTLPRTPSDHRSLLNAISVMQRGGFVWPAAGKER